MARFVVTPWGWIALQRHVHEMHGVDDLELDKLDTQTLRQLHTGLHDRTVVVDGPVEPHRHD